MDADDSLLLPLLNSINQALTTGIMPKEWRGGIVKLLLKREPNHTLSSWRPVCLLRIAYKLHSRIVTARLRDLAEKYHLLEYVQEGFRQRRSTRRQIERLVNNLSHARNNKHTIYLTYIDFTNAFNASDHGCILKILDMMGIPDLNLIKDLLSDSHFHSVNNVGSTAPIPLNRGVKQGAVESPLIFCLFINSLLRYLHDSNVGITTGYDTSNCCGFADDLALFTSSPNPKVAEGQHQLLLQRLADFTTWANIQVNISKCAISAHNFKTNKSPNTNHLRINPMQQIPPYTKDQPYKYLGVRLTLSGNLSAEKEAAGCFYSHSL